MGIAISDPLRVAANTSIGNQTLTFMGLGGLTPKAILIIATRALADGSAVDGAGFYWGMSDGTNEATGSWEVEHGQATMDARATQDTTADRILTIHDGTADSVVEGLASFVSFGADEAVINWTDAPASAFLLTVIAFAGSDLLANVGVQDLGNTADALIANTSVGFEADVVIAFWNNTLDGGGQAFGLVHNDRAGTVTQRSLATTQRNAFGTAVSSAMMRDGEAISKLISSNGALDYTGAFQSFDSSGWDVQLGNARAPSNADYAYLALRLGTSPVVSAQVYTYSTPTSTGSNTDSNPGFTPQFIMYLMNRVAAADTTESDADAGTSGILVANANAVFSNTISDEDGAADSNTQSLSDDKLNLPTHTGGAGHEATLTSMGATGPVWNYSATDGMARLWPALAIGINAVAENFAGEIPLIDETYEEEHPDLFAGWSLWQIPDDVVIADAIQPELPIIDDVYELDQDFDGFVQAPLAADNDVVAAANIEFSQIDEAYDEEHDYAGIAIWQAPDNVDDFQALAELPSIDDSYDEEHDYAGFFAWQIPDSVEDFQALAELPTIDENYDEEHDYSGFTTWQISAEDIEDFQPLAELPTVDESYDEEHDYAGFFSWQMPSDVIDVLPVSEYAQVDKSYDEAIDHDFSGFTSWQVPENVEDFQALSECPWIDEHYDETYARDFNGFVFWLVPDSLEDPLLGVGEFPQVDETYELVAEFFGWQTIIIEEPVIEEPPILAELPQIELYYEPYFEYSGWQHATIEAATSVLFGGARLVGKKSDQVIGRGTDQVVGVKKRRLRGLK